MAGVRPRHRDPAGPDGTRLAALGGCRRFISRTVPYLGEARDYYNSSIAGNGAYFGVAPWLVLLLRVAFVAMAAFSLWFLYRYYRKTNELLWLTTSSGVLLGTTFLVGSLGQATTRCCCSRC